MQGSWKNLSLGPQPQFYFLIRLLILETAAGGGVGRERERERNIKVREEYQLVASHTCWTGEWTHNLSMFDSWPGIKPPTFRCIGWRSNQQSHIGHGSFNFFILNFLQCTQFCSIFLFYLTFKYCRQWRKSISNTRIFQKKIHSLQIRQRAKQKMKLRLLYFLLSLFLCERLLSISESTN